MVSCSTDKETYVSYGFVCSNNLFDFVDIAATYTTDKGEETSIELTPSIMETYREDEVSGETSDGASSTLVGILAWRQSKTYDDEVKANLTVTFHKKDGIDYSAYKGKIMQITKYAYLHSTYTEEHKGWGSASSSSSITIDGDALINTQPDKFYGDALEEYIDKLVAEPIRK